MRSDRNLYCKNLIAAQDEILDLKRKFKILVRALLSPAMHRSNMPLSGLSCTTSGALSAEPGSMTILNKHALSERLQLWDESNMSVHDMVRTCGVQNHQIELLKDEVTTKDAALVKEHFGHVRAEQECDSLRTEGDQVCRH